MCDTDYELTGPSYLTCTDERFGGEVNTCEMPKRDCDIPDIANGTQTLIIALCSEAVEKLRLVSGNLLHLLEMFSTTWNSNFISGKVLNDGKPFKEGDKYPIVCNRGYYNTYTYINCVVGPSTYDPYSVPDCLRPQYGCPKAGFHLMKPLWVVPRHVNKNFLRCGEIFTDCFYNP